MADTIEILYDGFVKYEKGIKGFLTVQTLAQTKEWERYIALIIARLEERKKK